MNRLGTALATRIGDLLGCVCAALSNDGAGPPCWCGYYPGQEVSWDYCGECHGEKCGMGYVKIVNSYRSANFPNPDVSVGCTSPLVVELAVGSLRCIPVAEDDGSLPHESLMWEAGLGIMADMSALFVAIDCCEMETAIGEYTPLGPLGGCAGGEWQVWVTL